MQTSGLHRDASLHRYAWATAVLALLLVITGAVVTSTYRGAQAHGPEQLVHRGAAAVVGLFIIGLAFWLSRERNHLWISNLGWIALALVLAEAVLGMLAPATAALHAILAQLLFGVTVAIAVVTSPGWSNEDDLVDDHMRPPMRTLADITVAMVLVQIVLGASLRHKLLGAMSHIGFAVVVALAALMLGMCVLHEAPEHRPLRPAAIHLMVIIGIQVFLGFGSFILKLMMDETATAVAIVTTAHVATAALTLGATIVLSLYVHRYMRAVAPQREGARPTVAS